MNDRQSSQRTSRWAYTLLAATLVTVSAYAALLAAGDAQLNDDTLVIIVAFALMAAASILIARHFAQRLLARITDHIDQRVAEATVRQDRRVRALTNGVVVQGAALAEITGEIPRIDLPPDNVKAFELGRRVGRTARDRD